jgi:hypothetical protein
MVDRLSPIDQRPKPPPPASPTAENNSTPPLARRVRAIGDNGSTNGTSRSIRYKDAISTRLIEKHQGEKLISRDYAQFGLEMRCDSRYSMPM